MAKLKTKISFVEMIDKKTVEMENKLLYKAIKNYTEKAHFTAEDIRKNLSVKYEEVKNYSIKIRTFRWDGEIVLQRFSGGMFPSDGSRWESNYFEKNPKK